MVVVSPYQLALDAVPVAQQTVMAGGVSTHYWQYGDSNRPVDIVMIHGFRGDHHGLEPFAAALGASYNVIIPDLPGFGSSPGFSQTATIDAFAVWLKDFWAAIGANTSSIILGHSFGSIVVAASLAAGLPAQRVTLVNPIAANALKGPRGVMTRLAVAYYKLSAVLPERAGRALLANPAIVRVMSITMAKTKDKQLRTWIHDQHDQYFSIFSTRNDLLEAFGTSVSHDVSEYVTSLSPLPVLLVVGEKDDITALPEQKKLAAKLPRSEIAIIHDVGHLVHYEAPRQTAEAIIQFMNETSP